ncbi:MAG TPA: ketoacyl-ACP synthase III [Gemmatimonadetes bacterium]|jgi:3-oxoacyl-[acyl-carrier-protein] synthase-3|nr:ketoacyl-ACP synthase III [Gemmatimonadota bacterium]
MPLPGVHVPRTAFAGTGFYVPERVVTNDELAQYMDTSNEWIVERTGIEERRWVSEGMTGAELARRASEMALADAGIAASEVDAIVLGTLSPDAFFPGTGVFLQRALGMQGIPALDLRAQCSGFIYGLSVADAWIKSGQYRTILLVGVEIHSTGLDISTRGRDLAVLFGDGAGAAVLRATDEEDRGVLSTHIHADGDHAEMLWTEAAGSSKHPRISAEDIEQGRHFPQMQGRDVFKHAVKRMPEAVLEALAANDLEAGDIDLLIPHQANLRISQMVQRRLGLEDEQVVNNIQRYGNTTAATIPIALAESVRAQRLERGDLLCLVAFGSGLTWGSALVRW